MNDQPWNVLGWLFSPGTTWQQRWDLITAGLTGRFFLVIGVIAAFLTALALLLSIFVFHSGALIIPWIVFLLVLLALWIATQVLFESFGWWKALVLVVLLITLWVTLNFGVPLGATTLSATGQSISQAFQNLPSLPSLPSLPNLPSGKSSTGQTVNIFAQQPNGDTPVYADPHVIDKTAVNCTKIGNAYQTKSGQWTLFYGDITWRYQNADVFVKSYDNMAAPDDPSTGSVLAVDGQYLIYANNVAGCQINPATVPLDQIHTWLNTKAGWMMHQPDPSHPEYGGCKSYCSAVKGLIVAQDGIITTLSYPS